MPFLLPNDTKKTVYMIFLARIIERIRLYGNRF
jgi:hypothetical protein